MSTELLSIVLPIHNEQENINWLFNLLDKYFKSQRLSFEIIFIDDGSNDGSLDLIKALQHKHPAIVRFITFSRNFGKEAAVSAGIHAAKGDAAIIMDADGQHPIELLGDFIKNWHDGNDVVMGLRTSNRGEGMVKKHGSNLFHFTLRLINGRNATIPGSTDFRLIDRKVIDEYNKLTERNRLTRNLIDWLGFKKAVVPFEASERHAGNAAYSTRKLVKLAIDGVVAHSTRPLKFISLLGVFISTLAFIGIIFLTIEMYIFGDPLELAITGGAILALFLSFLVGIVLVCQGLLALYLESVYYETQNRPLYIVEDQSK